MKDLNLSAQGSWITVNDRYTFKVEGYVDRESETPVTVEERKEVAHRIVACVNACQGLPDAGLQPGILMRQAVHEQELIAQRDELLAALQELNAAICAGRYEDPSHDRIYQALLDARAAIARAKGGAA